jgi:hypothetical protein
MRDLAAVYVGGALFALGFVVGGGEGDPSLAVLFFVTFWPLTVPLALGYLCGKIGQRVTEGD